MIVLALFSFLVVAGLTFWFVRRSRAVTLPPVVASLRTSSPYRTAGRTPRKGF